MCILSATPSKQGAINGLSHSFYTAEREGNRDAKFACRTDDDDPDERKAQLLRCSAKFVWKTTHPSLPPSSRSQSQLAATRDSVNILNCCPKEKELAHS